MAKSKRDFIEGINIEALPNGACVAMVNSVIQQSDALLKGVSDTVYNAQKAQVLTAFARVQKAYKMSQKNHETVNIADSGNEMKRAFRAFRHGVNTFTKSSATDKAKSATLIADVLSKKRLPGNIDNCNGCIHNLIVEIETDYADDLAVLKIDGLFEDLKMASDKVSTLQQKRDNIKANELNMKAERDALAKAYYKWMRIISYQAEFGESAQFDAFSTYLDQLHERYHMTYIHTSSASAKKNTASDTSKANDKNKGKGKNKENDKGKEGEKNNTNLTPEKENQPENGKQAEPQPAEPANGGETQQDEPTKLSPADDDTANEQPTGSGGDKPDETPQPSDNPANGGDNDAGEGLRPAQ